jgi:hypothetical protein
VRDDERSCGPSRWGKEPCRWKYGRRFEVNADVRMPSCGGTDPRRHGTDHGKKSPAIRPSQA